MSDTYGAAVDRLTRVPGVRGAMVVDAEAGVPVLAELENEVPSGALAALASSLYRRAARAATGADLGELDVLDLHADAGQVIVAGNQQLLIVILAEADAQLGLLRLEARKAAESLR